MMQKLPIKIALPDAFFQQEEKCEYMVSADMKKVWAVELDLLQEFIRICTKYNLRWFVGFGTMLGAVRHKGFIPWDNDLDVVMPREDFNKLLSIGPNEFQHPYFFQNPETENGRFFMMYTRLQNSRTTGASPEHWSSRMNCGIYVDIYPLDYIPQNKIALKRYVFQLEQISYFRNFCGTYLYYPKHGLLANLKKVVHFIHYLLKGCPSATQVFDMYNKAAGSLHLSEKSGALMLGYKPNWVWNSVDWEGFIEMPFENLKVRVPVGYHNILTQAYGDYMQYPTDKATHDYNLYDAETPYFEYFAQNGYAYKSTVY